MARFERPEAQNLPQPSLPTTPADVADASTIARLMAEESARMARHYQRLFDMEQGEAREFAWRPADAARIDQLLIAPPEAVDWWALDQAARSDPELAHQVWERLKALARAELDGGHRAAEALDVLTSPWDRARFLATRLAFREEWKPRGAIEDALIDTLVHSHIELLDWLRAYHARTELRAEEVEVEVGVVRRPPTVSDVEARREAVEMIDRFNRLFLRTLRALREQRRAVPVVVQNVGQVNVAEQQVNIAQVRDEAAGKDSQGLGG